MGRLRPSAGTADAIDPARLLRAVAQADRSADVVVVYMHWGIQGEQCPSDGQRSLAANVINAGADIVVGSHAHRLQGDGRVGRGYVAYGLGNYAWYTQSSEATSVTGVLTLTVRPPLSRDGRAKVTDCGVGSRADRRRRVAAAHDPVRCSRLRGGPRRAARVRGSQVTDRAD